MSYKCTTRKSARMREHPRAEDAHSGVKSERSFEASEAGARNGIPRWSGNAGIKLEDGCFQLTLAAVSSTVAVSAKVEALA